jgi:opacity protein-like surface antigen
MFGGANFLQDQVTSQYIDSTHFTTINTDPDTGFVLGATTGWHITNWLRAEVEASYRRNDVGGSFFVTTDGTSGQIDANASTFAVMANVWYDVDLGSKVKPYIGGGAGWAHSKFEVALVTPLTTPTSVFTTMHGSNDGFAWQLGVGFNYEAAPGVAVGMGYRYFRGPDFEPVGGVVGPLTILPQLENENHSAIVNLSIDIN